MAQRINVALSSIPSGSRDLVEFIFFCAVGVTAGTFGLIWQLPSHPLVKEEKAITTASRLEQKYLVWYNYL